MLRGQKGFHIVALGIVFLVLLGVGFVGYRVYSNANEPGKNKEQQDEETQASLVADLPDISRLHVNPSDQFLVDYDTVDAGHPYLGERAPDPHSGAHVNFWDTYKEWPKGGDEPQNYPPIYAVADGVVRRVEKNTAVANHERYGLSLAIAKSGEEEWAFDYSIEPFVKEPSPGFYEKFLTVKTGDKVKKGQVVAYMYLPEFKTGSHIHFHMRYGDNFYAPSIFTPKVVKAFQNTWNEFGIQGDLKIPNCMGWKLSASENPFSKEPTDCI